MNPALRQDRERPRPGARRGLVAVLLLLAGSSPGAAGDPAAARHLIYLHGRIVQERQSARPRHPRFGTYELEAIRAAEGKAPSGHVLSIREASDDATEPCPAWNGPAGSPRSLEAREVVLHTGLGHGFLYRPLPEWVGPVADWAATP